MNAGKHMKWKEIIEREVPENEEYEALKEKAFDQEDYEEAENLDYQ